MPPARKGKKPEPNSQMTRKSVKKATREVCKKSKIDPPKASAPHHSTRSGLRSRGPVAQPFQENPEAILRKPRKSRKPQGATDNTQAQRFREFLLGNLSDTPARSIESRPSGEYQITDEATSDEYFDEELPALLQDTEPEQVFNRNWGYLPPLDGDAVAVIDAIIANPDMAKEYSRISPEKEEFPQGLKYRNVLLKESKLSDPVADEILRYSPSMSALETLGESESHDQTWISDRAKCNEGSSEALFRLTVMMSSIARHLLIYDRDGSFGPCLDFSVEEPWSCPPMPTRAYEMCQKFLTQPKPDLAVCFRRENLLPDSLWNDLPPATQRLACYEKRGEVGLERVFHFFTIEAKKAMISADDTVGKRQSLNNASQSLHNMFELFRDAGPKHEETFFSNVRFFSVVASTEGLTIRIHRAVRDPGDGSGQGYIMKNRKDYPLAFEHREFLKIEKANFDRKTVIETFERILIGYGAKELHPRIQNAARAIAKKMDQNPDDMFSRTVHDFYRYGQTHIQLGGRRQALAASEVSTRNIVPQRNGAMMSKWLQELSEPDTPLAMSRSGTVTPTQSRILGLTQKSSFSGKRKRSKSKDTIPERNTRTRK